jgi:hypothetical protein
MLEWLAERQQDRPHWFELSSGGGAHHGGGGGSNGARPTKPVKEWSDTEKVAYIKANGQEAYQALLRG